MKDSDTHSKSEIYNPQSAIPLNLPPLVSNMIMETPFRVFSLYYNTIKYLRPIQIYGRVAFAAKSKTHRLFSGLLRSWYGSTKGYNVSLLEALSSDRWSAFASYMSPEKQGSSQANVLLKNRFCFLNREIEFHDRVEWLDGSHPKLWRYNLHYFDYLLDLARAYALSSDARYAQKIMELVADWIDRNPLGIGDGWEPYPVSLRIVNWIKTLALLQSHDEDFIERNSKFSSSCLESLYRQASFLERNIEYHLLGNHLIKNAKALFFAGLFFVGAAAQRWQEKGLKILTNQLKEQVLDDGGHFERSPMYHSLVLEDYLDSLALIDLFRIKVDDASVWVQKIAKMASFLDAILHPDGRIALFNDSAFGIAPEPRALIARVAKWVGHRHAIDLAGQSHSRCRALAESGYFTIQSRDGLYKMIFDCGPIGPDYLPGHAHCDTLSFELSHQGERIIVDTGVFEYSPGALRDYSRSTRAHNTISVDGLEQSEIWSSFRVGRRAKPLKAALEDRGDLVHLEGSHDGYLKSCGIRHTRRMYLIEDSLWVIVDKIDGSGTHLVEGFVHLHPDVHVLCAAQKETTCDVTCRSRAVGDFLIRFLSPCAVEVEDGLYFPEFGKKVNNKTLRYFHKGILPLRLIYAITPTSLDIELSIVKATVDRKRSFGSGFLLLVSHKGRRRILSC